MTRGLKEGGKARRALALALGASLALSSAASAEIIDGVAVVVNGEIITLSEIEERLGGALPSGKDPASARRRQELFQHAADDLIAEKLISQEADSQGLTPSPEEVDAAIEDVKRANQIDDETLDMALQQQGMSRKQYKEMLTLQLARMKLLEMKVKSRVSVSDDDVRSRYAQVTRGATQIEEVHGRDIYLPKGNDPDGARRRVERARQRIASGEDFSVVAEETGGPFASQGGDLGWLRRGTMLPELEEVLFSLKDGELSEILEAGGGYHLLRVDARRMARGVRSFAEAREELRQQIVGERLQKATEEYVAELRREADVELKLK